MSAVHTKITQTYPTFFRTFQIIPNVLKLYSVLQ
nr:MAG TPA: hypothetical protein [Caudoviricetes sp.]DAT78812.1 MAG TPA: hypothetical protein [Caudoviricetes sp.]